MATLIQLRRDTSANWSSNNPTLSSGEIGIATDLQQFKIGNSASSWNQLEYVNAIPSQYLSLIAASANFLNKVDASTIYAPLGSASFVGIPTAPTATAGTNTHQIATTAFVRTEVTNLIDSAPGALDTLNELAAALGDDPNYAVSTASYIATKLDINNASATYLSISNAALTYVPISASLNIVDNYIPISSSYAYLTRDDASSLYIPITASGPYLTELEASALYVPISASANVVENYIPISSSYAYLTRSDAENTYIPISSSAEYLTESEAQGVYVPISSSANIVENYIPVSSSFAYLTRTDAESTYIPITSSAAYLTESEAESIYVPITASFGIVENYIPVSSSYVYLTRVDAESTYIPISSSAEYLTESEAAGIYVPISSSANVVENYIPVSSSYAYLTRTDAETIYIPITSSAAYLTEIEAAGLYIPISASFGTFDADKLDGRDSSYFINTSSESQEKLGNITFHGTVSIEDLVITGSALTISTTNLALTDSLIQLAHEQYSTNSVDIGIIGSYGDGTTSSASHYHASFARDASQNKWKLLSNGPAPVNNVIDYSDPSVEYGILQVGAVEVSSSAKVNNLNADLLDDQNGSYYLDWTNTTNKPDPIISVNLTGNTTGGASVTLIDLTNGQISITTNTAHAGTASSIAGQLVTGTVANATNAIHATSASSINWSGVTEKPNLVNSVSGGVGITIGGTSSDPIVSINSGASVSWGNISSKPDPVIGVSLSGNTTGSASATLTDLNNGQITITTNTNFATSASSINWNGVTDKPDPVVGVNLIGNTTGAASATLTDLSNGQISITTNTAFATSASSINWSGVTVRPTTLSGYGITDAIPVSASQAYLTRSDASVIYAPLASASLTGIPTAPTAASGTNTQQIATTAFVRTEVSNLIASAPATLDTLNELAAALGNDPNFATSTASAIGQRLLASTASTLYMSIGSTANHANSASSINWLGVTNTPTTLSGYNISDGLRASDAASAYIRVTSSAAIVSGYIPVSASQAYLTRSDAQIFYVPISASSAIVSGYIPVSSSQAYLTRTDAQVVYIPISASSSIVSGYVPVSASSAIVANYIPVSASQAYLTRSDATNTYLPLSGSISWGNVSNKPSPIVAVNLTGEVTGAASATLTNLTNGQISITTTISPDSVALGTDTTGNYVANVTAGNGITISGTAGEGWSPTITINSSASVDWGNVSNKPDPIVGVSLTGAITGAASATLTDLTNGQISVTTSYGAISTNAQTGTSYTLALSDAGKIIEMNNAAANLVVIPLNSTAAFPTGTKIDIIQTGAGATSASIVSGVTLNSEAGKRTVNAQWQAASLVKRGTDTWVMIGAIKA